MELAVQIFYINIGISLLYGVSFFLVSFEIPQLRRFRYFAIVMCLICFTYLLELLDLTLPNHITRTLLPLTYLSTGFFIGRAFLIFRSTRLYTKALFFGNSILLLGGVFSSLLVQSSLLPFRIFNTIGLAVYAGLLALVSYNSIRKFIQTYSFLIGFRTLLLLPFLTIIVIGFVDQLVRAFGLQGVTNYALLFFYNTFVLVAVGICFMLEGASELIQNLLNESERVKERTLELSEANTQLRQAKQRAEIANKAKSEFLANMSHELRTPLNSILGFAQIMTHNPSIPSEEQEHLDVIQQSGDYLLKLIDQVLDFSKIEAGRLILNERSFDLYHLIDGLEDIFSLKARQKGLHISVHIASDVPKHVYTDELKLRQVLINLLSNAIKFTQKGDIRLSVDSELLSANGDQFLGDSTHETPPPVSCLLFTVKDTGAGIAREEMEHIFEAFAQTETGRQAQEGTGLGLAISRKLVQLMGGDMSVMSELGRGTTLRFDIQALVIKEADTEDTHPIQRAIALEPGQPSYRLLIVDDKAEHRKLLFKLLQPFGFALREAGDGQEAIHIWKEWKPHLIWMDLRMPGMGGYEATQQIRQLEARDSEHKTRNTIIILLSSSGVEDEHTTALSKGCHDFLRKPYHEADVFDLMQKHLGLQFVYEDGQEGDENEERFSEQQVLLLEALTTLPSEMLVRLENAVITCDMNTIALVVAEIRYHDPFLARVLTDLAEKFKYTAILNAIQESQNSPLT